jgi:hypothetical protein
MTEDPRFSRRALLFAPCAYNLAETTRMIEIANAVRAGEGGDSAFEIRFISEGGAFERLIIEAGFPVERLEPRITPAQIERAYKLDKGEAFGAAFSAAQCIEKIEGELAFIREIRPIAIVTGSYVTIPLTHRIAGVPLVWVVQSTWLEGFFKHGAGMTGSIRPAPVRRLVDLAIYRMIDLWMRFGLLNSLNGAANTMAFPGSRPCSITGAAISIWLRSLTISPGPSYRRATVSSDRSWHSRIFPFQARSRKFHAPGRLSILRWAVRARRRSYAISCAASGARLIG